MASPRPRRAVCTSRESRRACAAVATVRYDWLAQHVFDTIDEVQAAATRWLWTYNHERPNMALGGITPKQKLALATSA